MKIACDRCEKVTVYGSNEFEEQWRSVQIYKAGFTPSLVNKVVVPINNSLILCDDCYDKLMDFVLGEKKANT